MTTRRADLNIDLGELPNEPPELYELAHRVNIACGGHAGNAATMRIACERALQSGTLIGAHPSFPDREHFGRRALVLPLEELRATIRIQCGALLAIATSLGARVSHLKLHGALYHAANQDPELARAVLAEGLDTLGATSVVGPPAGMWRSAAEAAGASYLAEGFADRGYSAEGTLLARGTPGALIEDPRLAAHQAEALQSSGRFDTLCVHSDTPNAVAIARAVRELLDRSGPWT